MAGNDVNTLLLIQSDTTDGSTTFTDSSASGRVVTPSGDAHHEVDQTKFGNTSLHFDGFGDYLSVPESEDLDFGSDDFTIDFWFYRTRFGQTYERLCGKCNSLGNDFGTLIQVETDDVLYGGYREPDNATWHFAYAPSSVSSIGWHHLALVRNGTSLVLYLDGVGGTPVDVGTTEVDNVDSLFSVGKLGEYSGEEFQGYVDDFRVSDTARWTANFTPPTEAYSGDSEATITGTFLLDGGVDAVAGLIIESTGTFVLEGGVDAIAGLTMVPMGGFLLEGGVDLYAPQPTTSVISGDFVLGGQIDMLLVGLDITGINGTFVLGGSIDTQFIKNEISGAFVLGGNVDVLNNRPVNTSGEFVLSGGVDMMLYNQDVSLLGGSFMLSGNVAMALETQPSCSLPSRDSSRWS